jgi:hypothetical protein
MDKRVGEVDKKIDRLLVVLSVGIAFLALLISLVFFKK